MQGEKQAKIKLSFLVPPQEKMKNEKGSRVMGGSSRPLPETRIIV